MMGGMERVSVVGLGAFSWTGKKITKIHAWPLINCIKIFEIGKNYETEKHTPLNCTKVQK